MRAAAERAVQSFYQFRRDERVPDHLLRRIDRFFAGARSIRERLQLTTARLVGHQRVPRTLGPSDDWAFFCSVSSGVGQLHFD